MQKPITVTRTIVMVAGLIQIVLGALFWAGIAKGLVPVHMTVGIILVITLWTLAFCAARAGVGLGLVIGAVVWGLIVPLVGMTQDKILPGSLHWIVQLVHLGIGLTALALANQLAAKASATDPASDPAGAVP